MANSTLTVIDYNRKNTPLPIKLGDFEMIMYAKVAFFNKIRHREGRFLIKTTSSVNYFLSPIQVINNAVWPLEFTPTRNNHNLNSALHRQAVWDL